MAQRRLAGTPLDFAALREELGVPGEFSAEAASQAATVASHPPLHELDRTDIEFITVDPPGSKDLDQAVHISRHDDGYLVSYAIADVAAFVEAGSPLDGQTRARGETYYFPDARVPLHPPILSEGAASLLAGQPRAAVLWQITLDRYGRPAATTVQRAMVRSHAQWDYASLQQAIDTDAAPLAVQLLPEVASLRQQLARDRHAINLGLAEQEVLPSPSGEWELEFRAPLPVEDANAEISLLTGVCAAQLMIEGRVGLLRTLPPPSDATVAALRSIAPALGVDWPADREPGDVLAGLDLSNPQHAAFAEHASSLLRGAGYVSFDGNLPDQQLHAGIGAPYAHVTAPLRRLADRFATEVCLALAAGQAVPDWVRRALPTLPAAMSSADRLAHTVDRAVVDATEAFLLADRIGQKFDAVVLETDAKGGVIAVDEPAVRAQCSGENLPVGQRITAVLDEADVHRRSVRFSRVA
jgi:exoribonuclease R